MQRFKIIRRNLDTFRNETNVNTIYPKGTMLMVSTTNNGITSAIKEGNGINTFDELPYLTYTDNLTGFTVKREYLNFTGNTLNVTDSSLPDIKANIHVYINGLLKTTNEYNITEDTIVLTQTLNTPSNVIVFWFVDKENYYGRLPSTVTDLNINIIGNNSALLSWTCGGAFANQGVCEKYRVYYSTVKLTQANYHLHNYVEFKSGIGQFGQQMSGAIAKLKPSTVYYFAIIGVYNNKIGRISNVPFSKTKSSLTPTSIGSSFTIKEEDIIDFHKNVYYVTDETDSNKSVYTTVNWLCNGDIVDKNGVPDNSSVLGPNYFQMSYTGFQKTWSNYTPYEIVFDLREVKRVDSIWFWFVSGSNVNVYTSSLGNQFNLVGSIHAYNNRNKWSSVLTNEATKLARYIKLSFTSAEAIKEVAIFGSVLSGKLPVGIKYPNNIERKRFERFVGSNAFPHSTRLVDVANFGTKHRLYCVWQNFTDLNTARDLGTRLYGDDSGTRQISYYFSNNRILGNLDSKLQVLKNELTTKYNLNECDNYICMKQAIQFMYPDPQNPSQAMVFTDGMANNKMCDINVYPEYNSFSPFAYRLISQFIFTLTARYGRNVDVPDELIALNSSNQMLKGMDLLKYIEVENEPNRTWEGSAGYYHPEEFAALISACYDGHMGQLGPGFGMKAADPTMKFVSSGLISQNLDYTKRVIMWCQANRTDPDYPVIPFDILSIHYYHTTTGGQTTSASDGRKGLCPDSVNPVKIIADGGRFYDVMKYMTDWRDRELPGVELWLGESGYDEHPVSRQSPIAQQNRALSLIKSDYIMRMMLHQAAANVDAFQQYMFRNDRQLSAIIYGGRGDLYGSCGFVDYMTNTIDPSTITAQNPTGYAYNDSNPLKYSPLPSYYYSRNLIKQLTGMKFSHNIRIALKTYVNDILLNINTSDPVSESVCALVFKPDSNDVTLNKTSCIVLWVGTSDFMSTSVNVAISDELTVKHTIFDDCHLNPNSYGIDNTLLPIVNNNVRYVQVPINGVPSILWTTNIGKKNIETPILSHHVIDANTVRLYWTDKNKDNYATEVLKFNTLTSTYDSIFKGYLNGCEYDVTGLIQSTEYKFAIRFVDLADIGERESELSDVVNVTTPDILPSVTNVRQGNISYNNIQILWNYDSNYTGMTEGFNIFKSETPTGRYDLIASINNTSTAFTDYSVVEDSTYYYKLLPFSSLATGTLSGFVGVTTLAANFNAPQILAAKTDFFGSRISLFFDIPLNNNILITSNITIIEGVTLKTPSSVSYVDANNQLIINLTSPITTSDTVLIGYDGNGLLSSRFGTPVSAFTDMVVVNNLNNETLVGNKFKVKYNADSAVTPSYAPFDVPLDETDWNLFVHVHVSATSSYKQYLKNDLGVETNITASALRFNSSTASNQINTVPQAMELTSRNVAVGEFPAWAIGSGRGILTNMAYPNCTQYIGFHNLDPNKRYFVKQLITSKTTAASPVIVEQLNNFVTTPNKTLNVYGNTTQVYSTGLVPQFIPSNSLTGTVVDYNTSSILLGYRIADASAGTRNPAALCAVILCEVADESL